MGWVRKLWLASARAGGRGWAEIQMELDERHRQKQLKPPKPVRRLSILHYFLAVIFLTIGVLDVAIWWTGQGNWLYLVNGILWPLAGVFNAVLGRLWWRAESLGVNP